MSIQANFPALKPSLLLDFANTKQLDPRITFTRASTATFYDGVTTAKAEENLLIQSQTFNVGGWSITGCVATGDALAAPDGTATAELLTANTTGTVGISQAITTGAIPNTFSVFAKAGTCTFLRLLSVTGTNSVWFDLTNGVVGTVQGTTTASISNAGNGWYRCSVTSSVGGSSAFIRLAGSDGSQSATNGTTLYVWGAQLEQRSTVTAYTATTTQAITNYIPVLRTAASGVARFDHNPITFDSLGLEIEESRTNLVLQSETFATTWTPVAASITANTVISPGGTLTADLLREDTFFGFHYISQSVTTTATATTFSVYAKAAGRSNVVLAIRNSANTILSASFNLINGTVSYTSTGLTQSIVSVGNGWYRCVITVATAFAGSNPCEIILGDGITNDYTGNGFSGIYIWGAQVEAGAFATSYIPTVASQVTRAADAASMTGTNFSSWYNQAQGTLYAEYAKYANISGRIVNISNNTGNNQIRLNGSVSTAIRPDWQIVDAAVTQANVLAVNTIAPNVFCKTAGAYATNSFNQATNALLGTEDTSGTVPSVSQMNIGSNEANTAIINGTIKKIAYYPLRVSNAQLQALTS